jgi:hypothetical protein
MQNGRWRSERTLKVGVAHWIGAVVIFWRKVNPAGRSSVYWQAKQPLIVTENRGASGASVRDDPTVIGAALDGHSRNTSMFRSYFSAMPQSDDLNHIFGCKSARTSRMPTVRPSWPRAGLGEEAESHRRAFSNNYI